VLDKNGRIVGIMFGLYFGIMLQVTNVWLAPFFKIAINAYALFTTYLTLMFAVWGYVMVLSLLMKLFRRA